MRPLRPADIGGLTGQVYGHPWCAGCDALIGRPKIGFRALGYSSRLSSDRSIVRGEYVQANRRLNLHDGCTAPLPGRVSRSHGHLWYAGRAKLCAVLGVAR